MLSWKKLLGQEDATPRVQIPSRQVPARNSSMNQDNGGNAQLSRFPSNSRSSGHDGSGRGSRKAPPPPPTEERCVCEECEIKALVHKHKKRIREARELSQPRPEFTQDDIDNIVYCSAFFRQYFEQQDKGVIDYANWLFKNLDKWKTQAQNQRREIDDLQLKLATAESVSDALQKELKESKAYIQQIQKEAMSTVDRFQPTTDGEVTDQVKRLAAQVDRLINTMIKGPSTLSDEQWETAAAELICPNTMAEDCCPLDVDVRTLKKMTLRNIVWNFLTSHVFDKPFGGFEGDEAESADDMYNVLFPRKDLGLDSESWRSLTAAALERRSEISAKTEHLSKLFQQIVVHALGYDEKDEALIKKVAAVMAMAINFWNLTAQQRAIFFFKWYDCASDALKKDDRDHRYTTVEAGDDDEEQTGQIWFITRPGLAKCGSGSGKGYDRTFMFEDFKAHVMVVGDARYLPQEDIEVDLNQGAKPQEKHVVLNGGAEDHLDPNAMELDADPVGHANPPISDNRVGSTGEASDTSDYREATNDSTNASFRDRMAMNSESSKESEAPKIEFLSQIGDGGQTSIDAGATIDKIVEAMSPSPDMAGAGVTPSTADGRRSSMSGKPGQSHWHQSEGTPGGSQAVAIAPASVPARARDVNFTSVAAR